MTYHQEYYKQHRAVMIDRATTYYQQNREKYLAYMKEYNKAYYASHYVPTPPRVKEPKPKRVKEPKPPKEKKPKKNTKKPLPSLRMEQGNVVLSFFD